MPWSKGHLPASARISKRPIETSRDVKRAGEVKFAFASIAAEGGAAHGHVLETQVEIAVALDVEQKRSGDVSAIDKFRVAAVP